MVFAILGLIFNHWFELFKGFVGAKFTKPGIWISTAVWVPFENLLSPGFFDFFPSGARGQVQFRAAAPNQLPLTRQVQYDRCAFRGNHALGGPLTLLGCALLQPPSFPLMLLLSEDPSDILRLDAVSRLLQQGVNHLEEEPPACSADQQYKQKCSCKYEQRCDQAHLLSWPRLAQSSAILFLVGWWYCLLPEKRHPNHGMLFCLRGL